MADLRRNFSLLVIYLLLLFSLEFVHIENQPIFDFEIGFYWVMTAAIVLTLIVPWIRSLSIYSLLALWGGVFIVVSLLFLSRSENEFTKSTLVSFLFVEVAVWVAHQMSQTLDAVEALVRGLANHSYPNRTLSLNGSIQQIDTEFSRSRRHSRPLTLLLVQPEKITGDEQQLAYKELRQDLLQHFANARIGQLIAESARSTDLIIEDEKKGLFLVLCTETEREKSPTLGRRITNNITDKLKSRVKWGTASFPEDALTMDELIKVARGRFE